jgi:molybdopterin synthase sulfur carrier subunit
VYLPNESSRAERLPAAALRLGASFCREFETMATVWIPSLLRDLTQGQETVYVAGANVGEVIDALDAKYPGLKDRLCHAGSLRRSIAVAVDTEVARLGLLQPVGADSEVHFVAAIAGG